MNIRTLSWTAGYSLCLALILCSPSIFAARPMVTDDARVVDPKSCQLESWVKRNRGSMEYWALPGCNVGERLELSLGGAITREDRASENTDIAMQAKTIFKPLETNGYGYGLVVGYAQHPRLDNNSSMIGNAYAYMPISASFFSDKLILHTNLGALHDKELSRTNMTWGIGSEIPLPHHLELIAETFGDHRSRPYYQAGLRYWIIPERVQIDTTYGNRLGTQTEERWFSIGLRLLSAPLW
ncbi:hypothetical protein LG201_06590 [Methylobacillus gramineus]|uniref:hypothetical protein n=1 Tax=Methylobacillus gramineus TaxID=755169 RepID=UPI001CFF7E6D|nr:hypothetical protein [Methylobacillus gramineus]MCB5184868.1 hypothetical protein [Methylobacillus gramineus]